MKILLVIVSLWGASGTNPSSNVRFQEFKTLSACETVADNVIKMSDGKLSNETVRCVVYYD